MKNEKKKTHLFIRQIFGSVLYIHTFQPYADSARGNQDNFMTMTLQIYNSLHYGWKCWNERLVGGFINNRRSSCNGLQFTSKKKKLNFFPKKKVPTKFDYYSARGHKGGVHDKLVGLWLTLCGNGNGSIERDSSSDIR